MHEGAFPRQNARRPACTISTLFAISDLRILNESNCVLALLALFTGSLAKSENLGEKGLSSAQITVEQLQIALPGLGGSFERQQTSIIDLPHPTAAARGPRPELASCSWLQAKFQALSSTYWSGQFVASIPAESHGDECTSALADLSRVVASCCTCTTGSKQHCWQVEHIRSLCCRLDLTCRQLAQHPVYLHFFKCHTRLGLMEAEQIQSAILLQQLVQMASFEQVEHRCNAALALLPGALPIRMVRYQVPQVAYHTGRPEGMMLLIPAIMSASEPLMMSTWSDHSEWHAARALPSSQPWLFSLSSAPVYKL